MPTKFDFVSPGIQLREIDQSQVTTVSEEDGLLLIGRSRKGPAMKPIKVNSLENFIDVFGNPMDGVKSQDPWRDGNTGAPSYAGYAAQAYLASGVGPVKFIRLGGLEALGASSAAEKAGWSVEQTTFASPPATPAEVESAIGIFVAPNTTPVGATAATATITVSGTAAFMDNLSFIRLTDGEDNIVEIQCKNSDAVSSAGVIGANGAGTTTLFATRIAEAINATSTKMTAATGGGSVVTVTLTTLGTTGNGKAITQTNTNANVAPQSSFSGATNRSLPLNGTLAAVLYMSASNITLSGTGREGTSINRGGATAIVGGTNGWTAFISGSGADEQEFTFNFDPSSEYFIRNAFNTDATEFESGTGEKKLNYFLGESFERAVNRLGTSTGLFAFTAGIVSGSDQFTNWQSEATAAKSGWFIGAKPTQKKLFRLVSLEDGDDFHKNYVVRIKDLR